MDTERIAEQVFYETLTDAVEEAGVQNVSPLIVLGYLEMMKAAILDEMMTVVETRQ